MEVKALTIHQLFKARRPHQINVRGSGGRRSPRCWTLVCFSYGTAAAVSLTGWGQNKFSGRLVHLILIILFLAAPWGRALFNHALWNGAMLVMLQQAGGRLMACELTVAAVISQTCSASLFIKYHSVNSPLHRREGPSAITFSCACRSLSFSITRGPQKISHLILTYLIIARDQKSPALSRMGGNITEFFFGAAHLGWTYFNPRDGKTCRKSFPPDILGACSVRKNGWRFFPDVLHPQLLEEFCLQTWTRAHALSIRQMFYSSKHWTIIWADYLTREALLLKIKQVWLKSWRFICLSVILLVLPFVCLRNDQSDSHATSFTLSQSCLWRGYNTVSVFVLIFSVWICTRLCRYTGGSQMLILMFFFLLTQ